MQLDMHYYGTYALARMAGLNEATCKIVATSAQFVDDNAANLHLEFQDGGRVDSQATAHHVYSIIKNLDVKDQRHVWVPFHFLPGNKGKTFTEKIICGKNSDIAREMVNHHLTFAKRDAGRHLLGIAAHVYADTFSHHGFSGIGSRRNKVDNNSFTFDSKLDPEIKDYITEKTAKFFISHGKGGGIIANIKSWIAETASAALGHGAVATYPDRPYLKWGFDYEYPKKKSVNRDNPADFLEGCRALHGMFEEFGKINPGYSDHNGVQFSGIKPEIMNIIQFQGKMEKRINKWKESAKKGALAGIKFSIPAYNSESWLKEAANKNSRQRSEIILSSNLYRFYQAASLHRQYVVRDLCPSHGLVVA
jgi:hypothetical protein